MHPKQQSKTVEWYPSPNRYKVNIVFMMLKNLCDQNTSPSVCECISKNNYNTIEQFCLFTATASHDLVSNSASTEGSSMSMNSSGTTTTSHGFASVSGLTDCDSVSMNIDLELVEGNRASESQADSINENVNIHDANINSIVNENAPSRREIVATQDIVTDTALNQSVVDVKPFIPINHQPNIEIISISSDDSDSEGNGAQVKVKIEPNSTWQHEKFLMKDEIRRLHIHCRALQERILNPNYDLPIASSTLIDKNVTNSSAPDEDKENSKSDEI